MSMQQSSDSSAKQMQQQRMDGSVMDMQRPVSGPSARTTRPAGDPMLKQDQPMSGSMQQESNDAIKRTPSYGQMAIILAGMTIGLVMMGIQLWLLTIALELYLSGENARLWLTAAISGLIFLGGVVMIYALPSRPRIPRVDNLTMSK